MEWPDGSTMAACDVGYPVKRPAMPNLRSDECGSRRREKERPCRRGAARSTKADCERRDRRRTKTPRRRYRSSRSSSDGCIVAHEATVVEPTRAFFRVANRRPELE